MLDFAASRVERQRTDPSRVIQGILETGASVARSELAGGAALAGGIERGLGSIAQGIKDSKDPVIKARKAQAQQVLTDADQKDRADAMRAGSSVMTNAEAAAQSTGSPIDLEAFARQTAQQEWGIPFDQLPAAQQNLARSLVSEIGGEKVRIRPGKTDDARDLGPHGSPDYVGMTAEDASTAALTRTKQAFQKQALSNPHLSSLIHQRSETERLSLAAASRGDVGGAAAIRANAADPEKIAAFSAAYASQTPQPFVLPDGRTVEMTLGQAAAEGWLSDRAFVQANRSATEHAAPGIGIRTAANGKRVYHATVDEDVVDQFDPKSPERVIAT